MSEETRVNHSERSLRSEDSLRTSTCMSFLFLSSGVFAAKACPERSEWNPFCSGLISKPATRD